MIEREIKFKVDDLLTFKKKIESEGGVYVSEFFEDNIVFDDEEETLRKSKVILRLRKSDRIILTVKKQIKKDRFKIMDEHEIEVSDFNKTIMLLNILGYKKVFRYQKRREIFSFINTKLFFDDTPIGCFIEIEGGEAEIESTATILGLNVEDGISKNYMEIFREHCKITGKKRNDMIF